MSGKIKHSNEYKTLEDKSITKTYQISNKWIEYKICELNGGNTKLSNVWKNK